MVFMLLPAIGRGEELTVEQREVLAKKFVESRGQRLPELQIFAPSDEELEQTMRAASAKGNESLKFAKGNGVRLLSTGHSWVAPAIRTLPLLTKSAGIEHHQRAHISGGFTGSANSIWLTEFGKFPNKPATPTLLSAIATGQWDVLSCGSFYGDKPECFTQWIDVCLKHNPEMTFLMQDGWPVFPQRMKDAKPEAILADMEAQHLLGLQLTTDMYEKLNRRYSDKVRIIPAGEAVLRVLRHYFAGELPGFDCVSEHLGGKRGIYRDGGHLSGTSGMDQIVGYTYFSLLYRKSPERLTEYRPTGLDPDADRLLRRTAWQAVISSPLTGITDKAGQGVAD
jgi:hypothetical protein